MRSNRYLARRHERLGVLYVGPGARGVEDEIYLRVFQYGVDTVVRGLYPLGAGPLETLGVGLYPGEQRELHVSGVLEELVHEVATDIVEAQDGDLYLVSGSLSRRSPGTFSAQPLEPSIL